MAVVMQQMKHEMVTERIRARMTEGASLVRVGLGRVEAEA